MKNKKVRGAGVEKSSYYIYRAIGEWLAGWLAGSLVHWLTDWVISGTTDPIVVFFGM